MQIRNENPMKISKENSMHLKDSSNGNGQSIDRNTVALSVDADAAKRFLTALFKLFPKGQKPENLYFRSFKAKKSKKDIPAKSYTFSREEVALGLKELVTANKEKGIYIIPNFGGHTDAEVTQCVTVMCENDDLNADGSPKTLDQVLNKYKELDLPHPSAIVWSGGKSHHTYWFLSAPVDVEVWKEFQADFVEFTDTDKSIKNPSRVMRMPGFCHVSVDHVKEDGTEVYKYSPSTLVGLTETRYDFEQLRLLVPSKDDRVEKENCSTTKIKSDTTTPPSPSVEVETTVDDAFYPVFDSILETMERVEGESTYESCRDIVASVKNYLTDHGYEEDEAIDLIVDRVEHFGCWDNTDELYRALKMKQSVGKGKSGLPTAFRIAQKKFNWEPPEEYTNAVARCIAGKGFHSDRNGSNTESEKETKTDKLINLAKATTQFYCDPEDSEVYAEVKVKNHLEFYRLKDRPYKEFLSYLYYQEEGHGVSDDTVNEVVKGTLSAIARYEGQKTKVYQRTVSFNTEKIYVDLGTEDWSVIEITQSGWQRLKQSPVKFKRFHQRNLPLPEPVPVDAVALIQLLGDVLLLKGEQLLLTVAFMTYCFQSQAPFPILVLTGIKGSGKTKRTEMIKSIIDPAKAKVRSLPTDTNELARQANQNWLPAFDNISYISPQISDLLCIISTGGGVEKRTLFTDGDTYLMDFKRPMILCGIGTIVERPDLLDRCIILNLDPIEEYISEKELDAQLKEAAPKILGGLFSLTSEILSHLEVVIAERPEIPRMGDFAQWGIATERALGLSDGVFMKTYLGYRDDQMKSALDTDPVADAIVDFIEEVGDWSGTASELLKKLNAREDDEVLKRSKEWTKTSKVLGRKLPHIAPVLKAHGIKWEYGKTTGGKRQHTFLIVSADSSGTVGNLMPLTPLTPLEAGNLSSEGFVESGMKEVAEESSCHYQTFDATNKEKKEAVEKLDTKYRLNPDILVTPEGNRAGEIYYTNKGDRNSNLSFWVRESSDYEAVTYSCFFPKPDTLIKKRGAKTPSILLLSSHALEVFKSKLPDQLYEDLIHDLELSQQQMALCEARTKQVA